MVVRQRVGRHHGPDEDGNPIGLARIPIARRGLAANSMQQKNDGDIDRNAVRESACSRPRALGLSAHDCARRQR